MEAAAIAERFGVDEGTDPVTGEEDVAGVEDRSVLTNSAPAAEKASNVLENADSSAKTTPWS